VFTKRAAAIAAILAGSLALTACGSSSNPLASGSGGSGSGSSSSASSPSGAASGSASAGSGSSSSAGSSSQSASAGSASMSSGTSGSASGSASAPAGGPIVIGSANFLEAELLAEVYAAALKAKGVDASTHLDIGSREVYLKAMQEGSINLLPEYTGGLLAYYDKASTATSPDDVYNTLVKALPDSLTVLDKSSATDQDSITVTKATADQYHLSTIGDLAKVAGTMTLGGSSEFQTRPYGPQGLKDVYGVVFKNFKVLGDSGGPLTVKALKTGLVQATDIFTTNPAIAENHFVVLKDTKNMFQAQNVVPLIAKSVATPTVTDALNAVSAKLTTEALTQMQKVVQDTKADPADVAAKWVNDNGLG
jgi:osmoprotectant transport system substrate-binding protein